VYLSRIYKYIYTLTVLKYCRYIFVQVRSGIDITVLVALSAIEKKLTMVKRTLASPSKTKRSWRKPKRRSRQRSSSSSSSTSTTSGTPSSTSPSSTKAGDLKRQLKNLKGEINRLKSTRSMAAHLGDEYLIPVFEPAKDDARIEHWVERVESLADIIFRLMID
jgi:hypothetical protein